MVMIEITEDKLDGLYENAEKMLQFGEKVRDCLDELKNGGESRYGERNPMPDYRGRGGRRGGMRDDYDDMRSREGRERRGRDYRGYGDEY